MLGKPQDGSLAHASSRGPVCPPPRRHPGRRQRQGRTSGWGPDEAARLWQRNPVVPFRVSFGACTQDSVVHPAKSEGSAGSRQLSRGFTAGSRAGPAPGQSPCCPNTHPPPGQSPCCPSTHPNHPQQHRWASGRAQGSALPGQALVQPAAGSHPSSPRAGSSFPSSWQIPSQPEIESSEAVGVREAKRSPSAQGVLQPSHQNPCPQGGEADGAA